MKSKHLILALFISSFFAIHACHQSNSFFQQDMIYEDITGLNLTDQFNAGVLQQKIILKEIDPHTLIHKAILENSAEVIQFLLKQGVSVDCPDQNGLTPLTVAIMNHSKDAVEVLLAHGANASATWNNVTLVGIAVKMNDCSIARLLFDHGANPTVSDFKGICWKCSLERNDKDYWLNFVEDIIKRDKIDVNAFAGAANESPLCIATEQCCAARKIPTPNGWIVTLGDGASVPTSDNFLLKVLMYNGADINNEKLEGCLPIYIAIAHHKLNIVKFLVENGADVNLKIGGYSPLQFALDHYQPEIVQYLLQHEARQ